MNTSEIIKPKRFVASAIIFGPGMDTVLLIDHHKYHRWMLPGGHLEINERPDETVIREVYEETGLSVSIVTPPWYKPIEGDGAASVPVPFAILQEDVPAMIDREAAWHVDFIYVCRSSQTRCCLIEPEIKTATWISRQGIVAINTFAAIRQLVERAFAMYSSTTP